MKKVERDDALEKLKKSRQIKVILISFKAGSTGMSLSHRPLVMVVTGIRFELDVL